MDPLPLLLMFQLLPPANSFGALYSENYHDNDEVYSAAMQIIESFDLSRYNTIDMIKIFAHHQDLSTDRVLNKVAYTPVRTMHTDMINGHYKRHYSVFLISGDMEFNKLKSVLGDKDLNFDGFFLLILSNKILDPISFCREVFRYFFSVYLLQVAVLYRAINSKLVNLYTFIPFSEDNCNNTEPVLFNFYENGAFQDTHFFPQRITNFYGCEITAIAIESPPFIEMRTVNGTRILDKGYEVFLIKRLAKDLNFKLKLILPKANGESPLGQVFKNGSASGPIGMMHRGEANLTIGWLTITKERLESHLLPSIIYLTAEMVLIAPSPSPYGPIELLLLPLSSSVWIIILIVMASSFPVTFILKRTNKRWRDFVLGRNNKTPIINLLSIWVNGWVPNFPRHNFARTLVAILLLSTMVVRSAYQGSVFRFLRSDKRHKPSLDLNYYLQNGYKIYTSKRLYAVIEQMSSGIDKYFVRHSGGETDYLTQLGDPNFKGLILTSIDAYKYYRHNTSYKQKDLLLPGVFFLDKIVMYFRWNSYLKRIFDKAILNIGGSGLFVHYQRSYFNHRLPALDDPAVAFVSAGWYYLCGIMLALSFLVLLLEMLSIRFLWIRRIVEYFSH